MKRLSNKSIVAVVVVLVLIIVVVGSVGLSSYYLDGPEAEHDDTALATANTTTTAPTRAERRMKKREEFERKARIIPKPDEMLSRCEMKYPDSTIQMLKRTLSTRGVRRVALIGLFRDCSHILPTIETAVIQVASILSPENVFVSFLESGSSQNDSTPAFLRNMSVRLKAAGVSNAISTGNPRISADWKPGSHGNRIDFLGRLRNAAMFPAFSGHPVGYFDKFFFMNDVLICGGDILKLLAHDADIACGIDYYEMPARFTKPYDLWVLDPLWRNNSKPMLSGSINELQMRKYNPKGQPLNVFACWNGGIASRAVLWYKGARFRMGMPELGLEDCSQSESSLWSMDAHRLGYHNIVLDPSIQVAYNWPAYISHYANSSVRAKEAVDSPNVSTIEMDLRNITYRCCEIVGTNRSVDFKYCHARSLVSPSQEDCNRDTAKCLRYPSSRWEEWDWRSIIKR